MQKFFIKTVIALIVIWILYVGYMGYSLSQFPIPNQSLNALFYLITIFLVGDTIRWMYRKQYNPGLLLISVGACMAIFLTLIFPVVPSNMSLTWASFPVVIGFFLLFCPKLTVK